MSGIGIILLWHYHLGTTVVGIVIGITFFNIHILIIIFIITFILTITNAVAVLKAVSIFTIFATAIIIMQSVNMANEQCGA